MLLASCVCGIRGLVLDKMATLLTPFRQLDPEQSALHQQSAA